MNIFSAADFCPKLYIFFYLAAKAPPSLGSGGWPDAVRQSSGGVGQSGEIGSWALYSDEVRLGGALRDF